MKAEIMHSLQALSQGREHSMTEPELRSLLRKSKKDGHRAVFDQYSNYVYAVVYSKLRSCAKREDIDDTVSDIFAEIFQNLDADREGSLQGYIGTVAKRMAVKAFYRLSGTSGMTISLDEDTAPEVASEQNIEQEYEKKLIRRKLLENIDKLGEPDATIIMQKYFCRKSAGQIADMLSMSASAVRKRSERAVKRLKQMLSEEDLL